MRRNAQFCFAAVTISGVIWLNSAGHSNPFTALSPVPLIYFSICLFSLYPLFYSLDSLLPQISWTLAVYLFYLHFLPLSFPHYISFTQPHLSLFPCCISLFLCPFVFEFHAAFAQPITRPRFPSQCLSTLNPPQSPLYPVLSLILLLPLIATLIPLSSSFFPSTSFHIPLWLSRWSANVPPNMGEPIDLKNGFSKRLWGWSITTIKANKGNHWMMHTPPITHKYYTPQAVKIFIFFSHRCFFLFFFVLRDKQIRCYLMTYWLTDFVTLDHCFLLFGLYARTLFILTSLLNFLWELYFSSRDASQKTTTTKTKQIFFSLLARRNKYKIYIYLLHCL